MGHESPSRDGVRDDLRLGPADYPDHGRRFRPASVELYVTGANLGGGKLPGLEEPGRPQPAIQARGCFLIGQRLWAATNGINTPTVC